jgi:F-type H+-transporting ATPase subunit O
MEELTVIPQYTAAAKTSSTDAVSKAMENLAATFKKDPKLQQVLVSPTLTVEDKKQIVAELQKQINVQDKTNTVSNFLSTLAENNRLSVLQGVTDKFAQLMSAARGEVELTVTSAAPIDARIVKQVETAVSKSQYVGAGKKLKVVTKVCHTRIRGEAEYTRMLTSCIGQPRYQGRTCRRDWRPYY